MKKIEAKIAKKNLKLKVLGFQIEFYQTDDWLGNKPMYEAKLVNLNNEDIEDAITGRYCSKSDVYEEIMDCIDDIKRIKHRIIQWIDDMYGEKGQAIIFAESLTPSLGINNPLSVKNHPFYGYELVIQYCSPLKKGYKSMLFFNFYKKENE